MMEALKDFLWWEQANVLADHFAETLNQTRAQYIESLPDFPDEPDGASVNFPLIVQPAISGLGLEQILELAGIRAGCNIQEVKDWGGMTFKTPDSTYAVWINGNSRDNIGQSSASARRNSGGLVRPGNVYEGISFFMLNPEILYDHFLDLAGSQLTEASNPYLAIRFGEATLGSCLTIDYSIPGYAPIEASMTASVRK